MAFGDRGGFSTISKLLNVKKSFEDAKRQEQLKARETRLKGDIDIEKQTLSNYNAQFVALIGQGFNPDQIVQQIGPPPGGAGGVAGGEQAGGFAPQQQQQTQQIQQTQQPTASIPQQPGAGTIAGGGTQPGQDALGSIPVSETEVQPSRFPPSPKAIEKQKRGQLLDLQIEKAQQEVAGGKKAKQESLTAAVKAQTNLTRVKSASSELMANFKQAVEEQGGFGFVPAGIAAARRKVAQSGLIKDIPPEKQFSGGEGFEGQLVEMTLALSPILTNQNRIIKGIVKMLSKTLPKLGSSEAGFSRRLKQTNKNAYRLSIGLSRLVISDEEIEQINSGSPEKINQFIRKVQARTTFTSQDEKNFEKFWKDIKGTPASKAEGGLLEARRTAEGLNLLNVLEGL